MSSHEQTVRILGGTAIALAAATLSGGAVWATSWARACTPEQVQQIVDREVNDVLLLRKEDLTRQQQEQSLLSSWKDQQAAAFRALLEAFNAIENQQVRTNVILEQIQLTLRHQQETNP